MKFDIYLVTKLKKSVEEEQYFSYKFTLDIKGEIKDPFYFCEELTLYLINNDIRFLNKNFNNNKKKSFKTKDIFFINYYIFKILPKEKGKILWNKNGYEIIIPTDYTLSYEDLNKSIELRSIMYYNNHNINEENILKKLEPKDLSGLYNHYISIKYNIER